MPGWCGRSCSDSAARARPTRTVCSRCGAPRRESAGCPPRPRLCAADRAVDVGADRLSGRHLTASGRTEIRIAGNLVANAAARRPPTAAFSRRSSTFRTRGRSSAGRSTGRRSSCDRRQPVTCGSPDEAARINPNLASPALIEALLRVLGSDPPRAAARPRRSPTGSARRRPRARGHVQSRIPAAGLDYGPPGLAARNPRRTRQVLGMTPALLAALRPHLTLYGPPDPEPDQHRSGRLAAALALIPQLTQATFRSARRPRTC